MSMRAMKTTRSPFVANVRSDPSAFDTNRRDLGFSRFRRFMILQVVEGDRGAAPRKLEADGLADPA